MTQIVAERPQNVPADLVVDFDFYHIPGSDVDVHLAWNKIMSGPEIFWTPRNGGHWVVTGAEHVEHVQRNWEVFSHASVAIPPNSTPSYPLEVDPPFHTSLRSAISPLFAPDVLKDVEVRAREITRSLIDDFYADGRCEFSADFGRKLPIQIFLYLVDLPLEDAPMLLDLAEVRVRSSDEAARNRVKAELVGYLGDKIRERRANPGRDFISRVLTADIGGRQLDDFEAQNLLTTLMFGGLDTVASMLGFVLRFLANSPEHRRQLRDEPALIPKAVNELIRRHGIANTARVVARDTDYGGVHFRQGDRVLAPNLTAGLDGRRYPEPLKVDFNRPNASSHAAFGNGPHRCPGANLGRMEIKIVLEEWLARIPDYRIDPEEPTVFATGLVNGVLRLPLVWDVQAAA